MQDAPDHELIQLSKVNAINAVSDAIQAHPGSSGGPFTTAAEAFLTEYHGSADAMLTTSCTSALELAALLLRGDGDETVVVPSFGFVTTALAFVRAGFKIRFVDIEEASLGVDPESLADAMDGSVRAVVPIHYGGNACEITKISAITAAAPRCSLVEDNAHSLFGTLDDRPLGTFGQMSALSFHGTKNISCGEGGALILNEGSLTARARVMYEKGTDRTLFLEGLIDKYQWRDIGSSFALSEYLAAILWSQLQLRTQIQDHRAALASIYRRILEPRTHDLGFDLPVLAQGVKSAHHLFYVILRLSEIRPHLIRELRSRGVDASYHYLALHESPVGRSWADESPPCPRASSISRRLLRLPLDNSVSVVDAERNAQHFVDVLESLT